MLDWKRLARLSELELFKIDIAEKNAACAAGLPGSGEAELLGSLRSLPEITEKVRWGTRKNLTRFFRKPWEFHRSKAYFRILTMTTILQRDCAVRYNPAKIPEDAPFDAADSFLFGALRPFGGTCASIPVLFISVGRRLGYPLYLVTARGKGANHFFARWEKLRKDRGTFGKETFNIEATAQGLSTPQDDHYRTGRYLYTPGLEEKGRFLKSLTPREELAVFLAQRFHCWKDVGNYRKAAEAIAWASALVPKNAFYLSTLKTALCEWSIKLGSQPRGFPAIDIDAPQRRFPETLPLSEEMLLLRLETIENLTRRPELMEPLRRGHLFPLMQGEALARFQPAGNCTIEIRWSKATA